jgi:hypothetical protein
LRAGSITPASTFRTLLTRVDTGCAVIHRGGNRLSLENEITKLKPAAETARDEWGRV